MVGRSQLKRVIQPVLVFKLTSKLVSIDSHVAGIDAFSTCRLVSMTVLQMCLYLWKRLGT